MTRTIYLILHDCYDIPWMVLKTEITDTDFGLFADEVAKYNRQIKKLCNGTSDATCYEDERLVGKTGEHTRYLVIVDKDGNKYDDDTWDEKYDDEKNGCIDRILEQPKCRCLRK
jgi:hypothetical protein